ncbi:MAG: hypothetical protein Kow0065_24140 [Methylomicrobium sp.]
MNDVCAPVEYRVDRDNRIIWVNDAWQCFAAQNGGVDLTDERVIGQSVLEFVSGKVSKQYWELLLDSVRTGCQPLMIEYRCDSPDMRRNMLMQLRPNEFGTVHIVSLLLSSQQRSRAIDIRCAKQRSKQTSMRCSVCNRVKYHESWREVDDIFASAKTQLPILLVTYAICPDCRAMLPANHADPSPIVSSRTDSRNGQNTL